MYRVLFRMVVPLSGRTASEVFADGPLEIEGPTGRHTTEAVLRLAPYVVSTFGEAFLLPPDSFPLRPGDRLSILREKQPIAVAMVAEELNPQPTSADPPSPGSP